MKTLVTLLQSLLALLLLLSSCVEPYAPAVIDAPPSLLVVDGFINADGPTTMRLSRTAALNTKATPPPETKAQLLVEDESGSALFRLAETKAGEYVSPAVRLNPTRKYHLRITTAKGQQYASDFTAVKLTPPIDAVSWKPKDNAVDILVNTHDDTHSSQYYRWEYDQTWEIRSPYQPSVEYANSAIRDIVAPYPLVCWGSNQSTRILLSKTTALNEDKVADFRVQGLPAETPELYTRYSILVRQQALTAAEYAYWDQLRKNTEAIGSLFDPQPSQSGGNVRNLDAAGQPALGFVGVHSVTEKRLFIAREELPTAWRRRSGYEACLPPDTIYTVPRPPNFAPVNAQQVLNAAFSNQKLLPIFPVFTMGGGVIGYMAKNRDCVDCRTRGAAVRPAFW